MVRPLQSSKAKHMQHPLHQQADSAAKWLAIFIYETILGPDQTAFTWCFLATPVPFHVLTHPRTASPLPAAFTRCLFRGPSLGALLLPGYWILLQPPLLLRVRSLSAGEFTTLSAPEYVSVVVKSSVFNIPQWSMTRCPMGGGGGGWGRACVEGSNEQNCFFPLCCLYAKCQSR